MESLPKQHEDTDEDEDAALAEALSAQLANVSLLSAASVIQPQNLPPDGHEQIQPTYEQLDREFCKQFKLRAQYAAQRDAYRERYRTFKATACQRIQGLMLERLQLQEERADLEARNAGLQEANEKLQADMQRIQAAVLQGQQPDGAPRKEQE